MIQLFLPTRFILGGPQAPPTRRSASRLKGRCAARGSLLWTPRKDEALVRNLNRA